MRLLLWSVTALVLVVAYGGDSSPSAATPRLATRATDAAAWRTHPAPAPAACARAGWSDAVCGCARDRIGRDLRFDAYRTLDDRHRNALTALAVVLCAEGV